MNTSRPITSFAPKEANLQFLENYSQKLKSNKSELINTALDMYRRYCLRKDLRKGFSEQDDADIALAMSDFLGYLSVIDDEK